MKRKSAVALFALVACVLTASSAYAFGFGFQENEEAMNALEAQDYEAFIGAIGETERCERFAENMTEGRFQQMAERHETRQAIEAAIESGDYDAWLAAMNSVPRITDFITEDNFASFVELHEAREEGDFETARAIAEELGIPGKPMGGMGMGMPAMGQGQRMQNGTGPRMNDLQRGAGPRMGGMQKGNGQGPF